jgi:hypothetical protein
MRLFLIISTFILSFSPIFGQKDKPLDFSKVDKFALQTPDSMTANVEKLALYLTTADVAASSEKKIRAIYVWVSQNIHYDTEFDLTSPFTTPDVVATQDADQVLAARKGVCMGYAQLFVALVQAAGLKAEMIEGIIKQSDGNIPKMGHAWVAVRLRKKADKDAKTDPRWYLCDPTWASPASKKELGTIKEEYFLAEPEDFIKDHLPLDPMWQLLEHPATVEVFSKETEDNIKKYVSKSSKNPFVFQDTINRFLKMDTLKRLEKATWRMLYYNPINDYIWFEVGKVYSRSFNTFNAKIAVLIQNSLDASTLLSDEEKFEKKLNMLFLYYKTFKDCFAKIDNKLIAEQSALYSNNFINALISAYRSGYQTAYLNTIINNNDRTTPRFLETIKTTNDKIDSTLSSARSSAKSLDSVQQKVIEFWLQDYEKVGHQKNSIFLNGHIEALRMNSVETTQKRAVYDFLSQGRMHIRKYKACVDSSNMLLFGIKNTKIPDAFFDTYSFLFDVEECALNGHFTFEDIQKKREKGTANDLIPYIQQVKDATNCLNFVKEKGSAKSKIIEGLIVANSLFFQHIEGTHESELGALHHSIAIDLWNENLNNHGIVKSDILYNLNLAENGFSNAQNIYKALLKNKGDQARYTKQISYLEEKKKDILKMRGELK